MSSTYPLAQSPTIGDPQKPYSNYEGPYINPQPFRSLNPAALSRRPQRPKKAETLAGQALRLTENTGGILILQPEP